MPSIAHLYLQLTFFEDFLYARPYAVPFLYVISSVETDFMCERYNLNI